MKPGFVWLSCKSIQWNLRKFSQSWGVLTFMDSESILYQSVWICIRWLWRIREIDLLTKNDNCRWSIQQYSTCWPPPQTQSMILCTYPGKVDFPKPPQRKKFLQKLLVKGPGYLPGLCRWYLRLKQCDCTHESSDCLEKFQSRQPQNNILPAASCISWYLSKSYTWMTWKVYQYNLYIQ